MLTVWVAPAIVPRHSMLGRTTGAQNAALISGVYSGETAISGTGAGGDATAVAVLSDLAAVARDRAAVVPAPVLTSNFKLQVADFRLQAADCRWQAADFRVLRVESAALNVAPRLAEAV